ncbi:MAG: DEAD/DEAH box helicase, partial [Puniceicoccales bacterium]
MEGIPNSLRIPDLWQQDAVNHLIAGRDVVVNAPTGAGKTYIFELLVERGLRSQAIYTVPTRALANDKLYEWRGKGWNVGLCTGDVADKLDAPVVVATLETQKAKFLQGRGPGLLVIDEYQMLADSRRGINYELAIALAPPGT